MKQMGKRMFDRFKENRKWKDYVNARQFECKVSFVFALIFVVLAVTADFHENFNTYVPMLRNVTLYIVQALIGVIGIIIAGVTIVFSVFNKDVVKSIERASKANVQNLVVSFEFLAFNVGVGIFLFLIIHFSLYSTFSLFSEYLLYFSYGIVTYFLFFIIFYSISLISNIVRMFYISTIYEGINEHEKTIYHVVNEVRIDYILNTLLKGTDIKKEDFLKSLDEMVEVSNVNDKEAIKRYLEQYYR